MEYTSISAEEFISAAREFLKKSDELNDGWRFIEDVTVHKCYLIKDTFIECEFEQKSLLYKAEYIIFYNLSYAVPSFSFNIWNSSGMLLTLKEIKSLSLITMEESQFYSVITQQEHPLFHRPYFIVHPCHTETLVSTFKNSSRNIIVTFLGLITPLLRLSLPMEYGL